MTEFGKFGKSQGVVVREKFCVTMPVLTDMQSMESFPQTSPRWLARLLQFDWLLLILAAPVLLFSERFSPTLISFCLAALASVWLARALSSRQSFIGSALNIPLLCLVVLLPLSFFVSADVASSLPKVTGLLFDVALFSVIARASARESGMPLVIAMWTVIAFAIALFSFVSTEWTGKLPLLSQIVTRIPHLFSNISPSAVNGLQSNEVGGVLTLLIPPFISVLLTRPPITSHISALPNRVARMSAHWFYPASRVGRVVWFSVLLLLLLLLVFTQSRSALFGTAMAVALILAVRSRAARWLTLGASVAALIAFTVLGPTTLGEALLGNGSSASGLDLASRQEIWQRALYAIQDFPFTGIGLNQFDRVVSLLYPLFLIGPDVQITHAHNMLLQVALDLGLAGLVAYVGLLSVSAMMVVRAYAKVQDSVTRALLLGFGAGLLAHAGYGLSDAITLGAKPSFEWWWSLAIIAGIFSRASASPATMLRISTLEVMLVWLLTSLIAIAFVGDNALLGVALAVLGGCVLGCAAFMQAKSQVSSVK